MRPAYIISAYKRPDLLLRLVRALGDAPVAIHIDRKSDIFDAVRAALATSANVTLLPRHLCHWGLFGHVRASLEGMKWFLGTGCDYAILLTGQCYPLKPMSEIEKDLGELEGRSVIGCAPFPKAEWMHYENGGYKRLDRFYVHVPGRVRPRGIKPWTRRVPLGLHPHGGSGYWCLSRACIDYVLTFLERHPQVERFFSTTFVPDEMVFQTLLANSPLKNTLIDAGTHYIDWSGGGANPEILGERHLPEAMASGAWFARKFDDIAVLDRIDALREDPGQAFPAAPWRAKADSIAA